MEPVAWYVELVNAFGWPGAVAITLGIVMWRVCVFLKDRLFNDETDTKGRPKGVVPRITEAHLDLVAAVKTTAEENTRTNSEILVLAREHRDQMRTQGEQMRALTMIIEGQARSTDRLEESESRRIKGPSGIGLV